MTTIGRFKRRGDEFHGEIITLSVQSRDVWIKPDPSGPDGSQYSIYVGEALVGAAWAEGQAANDWELKVHLDDPTFAAPIVGRLLLVDADSFILSWDRSPIQP